MFLRTLLALTVALVLAPAVSLAQMPSAPQASPLAVVDLTTEQGLEAVQGEWRYSDAHPAKLLFMGSSSGSAKASGTWSISPQAGGADFDDSQWEVVPPHALAEPRGTGKMCFGWYRLSLTIPGELDGHALDNATAVLNIRSSDYAEVWVDGELPRRQGQSGGALVSGYGVTNRVTAAHRIHPGQLIQVAVFVINGPISAAPADYLSLLAASLELLPGVQLPSAEAPALVNAKVERLHPLLDNLCPRNPRLELLAQGFRGLTRMAWEAGGLLLEDAGGYYRLQGGRLEKLDTDQRPPPLDVQRRPVLKLPPSLDNEALAGLVADSGGNVYVANGRTVHVLTAQGFPMGVIRLARPLSGVAWGGEHAHSLFLAARDRLYRLHLWASPPAVQLLPKNFGRIHGLDGLVARNAKLEVLDEGHLRLGGVVWNSKKDVLLFADQAAQTIYQWDPTRGPSPHLHPVACAGLALDKHNQLIVCDPQTRRMARVEKDGQQTPLTGEDGQPMTSPGSLNAQAVDMLGNVWRAGSEGIEVFGPDGTLLGSVNTGDAPTGVAFGQDGKSLFITAGSRLLRLRL